MKSKLSQNILRVQERIKISAENAGRDPAEIMLVAVSKTWGYEMILAGYSAGLRHFGENRPEEMAEKRQAVEKELGENAGIVWHCIGNAQSRKTRLVANYADTFHALDRVKIAQRLGRQLAELDKSLPIFLEVNISGEASKAGFAVNDWETDEAQRNQLLSVVKEIAGIPALQIQGLMMMAPWGAPSEQIRSLFARTRQLAEWLGEEMPAQKWSYLSMGMSDDFELAIAEGATHIRVGRAIFGSR